MSHMCQLQLELTSEEYLIAALEALGFARAAIEVSAEPQQLYGYDGHTRPEKAEIRIDREHVGGGSNDLGFRKGPDGRYQAIISDFDRGYQGSGRYGPAWVERLGQQYLRASQIAAARKSRMRYTEEVDVNGDILLTIWKR